ncbi:hypothetical protein EGW08_016667, partial [Elysia chlorotica]
MQGGRGMLADVNVSARFLPEITPYNRNAHGQARLFEWLFLISFMVDARGGAMRGCRNPSVRIIVPPRKCCMPTRVTCRLVKKEKIFRPPPLVEGEGLAARVLEMGPVGTKFLGPVLLEVPHYASLRGKEREVVVLRSDNGENWYEHPMQATEEAVAEALGSSAEELDSEEDLSTKRIKRILTSDLPMYFALVSRVTRVKQESTVIGMEGGVLSSNVVPQVQAVLPEGTLIRPIPIGLQAQPIAPELVAKLLGNRVAASPIVTIEPRRRKFHKPITLTIPVPRAAQKGMINQYGGDRPTLRLLFSLTENPNPAKWEDVTDTKPMTLVDDCVSFTTSISARFWLIDCQNVSEAAQMAQVLYQEAVTVPYMAKFVVFAKRDAPEEGKLRIFCMTDDKDDKTLEKQEKFYEVARSRDIEVLEGRPQFVEMAGNLIPVTKSGDQLHVNFRPFRENRLPCTVKIRDQDQEPSARVAFMKEPKVARGEAPQTPICNLNIRLPDMVHTHCSLRLFSHKNQQPNNDISLSVDPSAVIQDSVNRAELKLTDIADLVQGDWVVLAQQLKISISDINHIKNDYKTVGDQALAMLHFWVEKNGDRATGNELESALRRINRDDVVRKSMQNVGRVDDPVEAAAAKVAMDQSGFDTFKEEVGVSSKDSMKRGMSLDVQFDEQDMVKESESATEDSPSQERGRDITDGRQAPFAPPEAAAGDDDDDDDVYAALQASLDMRRPPAPPLKTPQEEEQAAREKTVAMQQLALDINKFAEMLDAKEASQEPGTYSTGHSVFRNTIIAERNDFSRGIPFNPGIRHNLLSPPLLGRPSLTEMASPEEETQESTEIVETYRVSEDGKTWKTIQKTTMITAQGTTERTQVLKGSALSSHFSPTFLPSSCCVELSGPMEIRSTTHVEHEVMYSRAELVTEHAPPPQQQQPITAAGQENSLLSPSSEGGLSYHEEPASVPEPTLPDGFKTDELVWDGSESIDEDSKAEEAPFSRYKECDDDGEQYSRDEDKYFPALDERSRLLLDESSEAEGAFRTAEQSMDDADTGMFDGSRGLEEDQLHTQQPDDNDDDMDETVIAKPASEDRDLSGEDTEETQERPDDSAQLLAAENASEKSTGSASRAGDLYAVAGDELGLDRREEMIDQVDKPGEHYTETVLDDGTVVKQRRTVTHSPRPGKGMSVVPTDAESRQEEEVEDTEEIMPDGTVHHVHKVHRHSVKVVQKALRSEDGQEKVVEEKEDVPGSHKEEVVETFKEPPKMVHQHEEVEEVLPDGTKVKRKVILNRMVSRTHTHQESFDEGSGGGRKVEDYDFDEVIPGTESAFLEGVDSSDSEDGDDEELSMHQTTDVEDTEEIMPDGTVHHVHKVHRHSVKVVQKALRSEDGQEKVVEEKEDVPGSHKEEVVETFQEPPRMVHQEDLVEEVLPDGTKVTRKVVLNRMVTHTHTHQESFDEGSGGGRKVEDYDFDEVIPGTESAFLEGVDSSDSEGGDDEELSMHQTTDVKETTEVLDDGTVVKKTFLTTEKSRKTRSRSGSVDRSETSTRVEEEKSRTSVVTEDASEPTTQDFSEIRSEMVESTGSQSDFGKSDEAEHVNEDVETFQDGRGQTSMDGQTRTDTVEEKYGAYAEEETSFGEDTIGKDAQSDLDTHQDKSDEKEIGLHQTKNVTMSARIISTEIEGEEEEIYDQEEDQYLPSDRKIDDQDIEEGAKLNMEILRSRVSDTNIDEEQDSMAATTGSDIGRAEEVDQDCLSECRENSVRGEMDEADRDFKEEESVSHAEEWPDTTEEEKGDVLVLEETTIFTKIDGVERALAAAPSDEEDEVGEPAVESTRIGEVDVPSGEENEPVVEETMETTKTVEVESGRVAVPSDEEDVEEQLVEETMETTKTVEVERDVVVVPSDEEDVEEQLVEETMETPKTVEVESGVVVVPSDEEGEEDVPVVEETMETTKIVEVERDVVVVPSDEEGEEDVPMMEEAMETTKTVEVERGVVAVPSDEEDEEDVPVVEETIETTKTVEVESGVVVVPSDEEGEEDVPVVQETMETTKTVEVERDVVAVPSDEEGEEDVPVVEETMETTKTVEVERDVVAVPSDEEDEEENLEETMASTKTSEVQIGIVTVPSDEEDEVDETNAIKEKASTDAPDVEREASPQTLSGYVSEEFTREEETGVSSVSKETVEVLFHAPEENAVTVEEDKEDDEELKEFEETERSLQNEEEFGSDQSLENIEEDNVETPQKVEIEKEISSEGQVEYPDFDKEDHAEKEAVLEAQSHGVHETIQGQRVVDDDDEEDADYHYESADQDTACYSRKKVLVETRMGSIEIEEIEPEEAAELRATDQNTGTRFQDILEKTEVPEEDADAPLQVVSRYDEHAATETDQKATSFESASQKTHAVSSFSEVKVSSEVSYEVVTVVTENISEQAEMQELYTNESMLIGHMPEVPTKSPHISSEEDEDDEDQAVEDQPSSNQVQEDDDDEEIYSTSMKILGSTPDEIDDIEEDEEKYEENDYNVGDEDIDQEIEEQEQLTAALMSQLSKSDSGEDEEQEQFSREVAETNETCLQQIVEHSTESETLAEDQTDSQPKLKSDFVRVHIPILEHFACTQEKDSRGTPSTESGSYSMKTEPSLKEAKEEDISEETAKSDVPDVDQLFGKIDKQKGDLEEDVDKAFEKYEKETPLVAPIDAKIGEDALEADEDIDRAFEVYDDETEQALVVPIDAEVGEDVAEVKEDIDRAFAAYSTESAPPAAEEDDVDSVSAIQEQIGVVEPEAVEVISTQGEVDGDRKPLDSVNDEKEEYEVTLSKTIVQEALYTSIETTRKMGELDEVEDKASEEKVEKAVSSDDKTSESDVIEDRVAEEEERPTPGDEEEKLPVVRASGIMAELQELEADQGRYEAMSDEELADDYNEEEERDDELFGEQKIDDHEVEQPDGTGDLGSNGSVDLCTSIDRMEITVEEPGPEQLIKPEKGAEESKLESEPEAEAEPEVENEQATDETVEYQHAAATVSSSEGERGVVSSSEGERAVMSSTDDEKEHMEDDGEDDDGQFECLPLDRPPSVSDFTLIESMDQEKLNISLGLVDDITARTAIHSPLARSSELLASSSGAEDAALASPGSLSAPRDSDMEKDSLQGDDDGDDEEGEAGDYDKEGSDDDEGPVGDEDSRMVMSDAQSDRPPSPSDFTLIASQDQESLNRVLGLDQQQSPEAGQAASMPWEEDLERAITDADAQSTESSDAAMMVGLDHMSTAGTDNNTMSGFSSESGQQEASPLEERDSKHGLYENYLREMDREFPEASAVAARQDEEEGEAEGEGQDGASAGNVEPSVSTLSLSEHTTVVESLTSEQVVSRLERKDGGESLEKWGVSESVQEKETFRGELTSSGGDDESLETGVVDQAEVSPQDRFDYADGNDDDDKDDYDKDDGVDDARKDFSTGAESTGPPAATTADLEEGALGPVDPEITGQTVERKSEITGQTVERKSEITGQTVERKSEITGQTVERKSEITGQTVERKSEITGQTVERKSEITGQAVERKSEITGQTVERKSEITGQTVERKSEITGQTVERKSESVQFESFSRVSRSEHGVSFSTTRVVEVSSKQSFERGGESSGDDLPTPVDKDEVSGSLGFSVSSQDQTQHVLQKDVPVDSQEGQTQPAISEETIVVKVETKEYVAYEHVEYKDDDDEKECLGLKSAVDTTKTFRSELMKQETKDISPEDLTEKPAAFDFPEHYSVNVSREWKEEGRGETVEDAGAAGGIEPSPQEDLTLDATCDVAGKAGEEALRTISSSSSEDGGLEVVHDKTGERIKMPWEVAHHYTRQFSEVFKEEQKSPLKHQTSLDLGAFYTRDKAKDEEFLEKSFYDEPLPSSDDVQDQKRVTFADERPQEEEETGKDDKDDTDSHGTPAADSESREPYECVKETYDSQVINIILETRQQVKEVIARNVYDPEFPTAATGEVSPTSRQTRQPVHSEFDESEEDAMFTFSPRSAEGYTMETRSQFTDVRSFSYEGHGVVSRESRMAHQELLMQEEDVEEEDRSLSPSRDSKNKVLSTTFEETIATHKTPPAHPTHFPMAVHSVGKSLADNEIYESSETERDSTEEKLSPIEETPSLDEMEEDTLKSTTPTVEKRVTFQTDRLAATRFSEQSVDDFKASSSSSELSVEPTLLAASYDLDSGSVCHVVAAYDISPDTVEKQGPAEIAGKAILSSPEDDVFEIDAHAAMAAAAASQRQELGYFHEESSLASSLLRSPLEDRSLTEIKSDAESPIGDDFAPIENQDSLSTCEIIRREEHVEETREVIVINGPTEVDYIPAYDDDDSRSAPVDLEVEQSFQPSVLSEVEAKPEVQQSSTETDEDDSEETELKVPEKGEDYMESDDDRKSKGSEGEDEQEKDDLKKGDDILDSEEKEDEETHPKEEHRPSATICVTQFEPDKYSIESDLRDPQDVGVSRDEDEDDALSVSTHVKQAYDSTAYDFGRKEVYHGKKALEPSPASSLFSETYEDQEEATEEACATGGSEPFVESVRDEEQDDIEMGEEEEEEDSGSQSDLDRPLSPTPDALRQGFFSGTYTPPQSGAFTPPVTGTFTPPISGSYTPPQPSQSQASTEEASAAIEQTAVTFVDSILEDVKVKVSSESLSPAADDQGKAANEPEEHVHEDFDEPGEDIEPITRDFSDVGNEKRVGVTLVKQISEDIPGIILTQHLHEEVDEDEYYGYSPQPSSISEEDEDRYNIEMEEAARHGETNVCEDDDHVSQETIVIQTQTTAITHDFPEDTPSDEEKGICESSSPPKARDEKSQKPLHFVDEAGASSGSPRSFVGEHMMASNLDMDSGLRHAHEELDTSLSQSDYGDTSSVDSFATVVVADSDGHHKEFDENRLAEIASMTSSFTSDMQISFHDEESDVRHRETEDTEEEMEEEDEEDEEEEVEVEDMERSQEWVSSTPEDNRESSSSLDSDRYEYVDRAALSIITEMSDEDKLEMADREDLQSEAGLSDNFGSSPDFNLQSSPGLFGAKGFFKKNGNGENVSSLSSSLAEFERLEQAIPLSSSLSSIEKDTHRDSFGGSYDERKLIGFPKLSEAQESESIASSLAEFEHLEKVLVISSSGSSVEKQTTSDSKSSGGSRGSNENNSTSVASSLNEFERLERELQAADSDGRKSSVESSARPSEASSLNSLNEFERLEHEMVVASELEAEALKIVSILESGVLVTSATQFGSSDLSECSGWEGEEKGASKGAALETDSLDGEPVGDDDDLEHDSLSEGHKAGRDADADSLDGESSEMTEMTSSVVYAGPDHDTETVAIRSESGVIGAEFDTDSLQGEAVMQLSSDSLALEQMLKTSDSTKFDTDSLFEIDDRMMRSGDSIGGHSSSGGHSSDKNVMHASVDSLEMDLNKEDVKERQRRDTDKAEEEVNQAQEMRGQAEETEASSEVVGAAQEEENLVIEGGPENDNLLECGAPQDDANLMMASFESAAWSMGSSGCTTSHSMSVSHSESSHSHDLMQVSTESDLLKGSTAAVSDKNGRPGISPSPKRSRRFKRKKALITRPASSRSSSQRSSPRRSKLRRDSLDEEKQTPFNPFADWGPYQETKKVYTMVEWEEMKRLKRERQQ